MSMLLQWAKSYQERYSRHVKVVGYSGGIESELASLANAIVADEALKVLTTSVKKVKE